ncbi:T9SS type A sorting domain-containing protein [Christiangramia crocea]|uniref:T9SS type A sorting domain-containing protein n=1 Tax=Christiangramia crocea TaxID=2904124 RepID=A0A9X2A8Q5_9FLAO|nr:T9SS type A sorting domain-containing protein [Gramella crocea]MCG9973171.1 T9SS type A sorting domain-containing protein [Gramella crocea]
MENITYSEVKFWRKGNGKTNSFVRCLAIIFIILLFPLITIAQTHPYGFLDGNVLNDDGKLDWQNVYTNTGLPAGSISTGIQFDRELPDDIFTGGSTKDHLPISGWLNKLQDGSSSDKTNILQAGAILIEGRIYFFGNRFSNEGATNIGFWFFKDDVNILNGTFDGEHEVGDLLVVAEISKGGTVGKIAAYEWKGSAANGGNVPSSAKSLIKIVDEEHPQPNLLAAVVNAGNVSTPWDYQAKGEPIANVMPPITFFEGFINVADLPLNNACFSSFLVETRASFSLTSILEDFVGSNFNVQPLVSIDDIADCESEFPRELVATPTGGIPPLNYEWKKDGVIIPDEDGASIMVSEEGTYSVTVTGSGVGGIGTCTSEADTATVTIYENPDLTNQTDEFCEDAEGSGKVDDIDLTGYEAAIGIPGGSSGTWYVGDGTGGALVSDATDVDGVTNGAIYTVSYTDENTCTSTAKVTFTINDLPDLTDQTDQFCEDPEDSGSVDDIDLTSYEAAIGIPGGSSGTWYVGDGTGGALVSDPSDVDGVTDGSIYTVSYTDDNTCTNTAKITFTIYDLPDLTDQTDDFCEDAEDSGKIDNIDLTGYESAIGIPGGSSVTWYEGDGTGGAEVSDAADIDGVTNGAIYTVSFSDGNSCTNTAKVTFTINALPEVNILEPPSDPVCSSDVDPSLGLVFLGSPSGGTWSGDVDTNGNFVPDLSESTQTIRYDYTDGNGCSNYDEITFEYEDQPQDDIFEATYCVPDAGLVDLSIYVPADATNVEYSGNGVDSNGNFTGNSAGVYLINITYNVPAHICRLGASISITLENCVVDEGCTLGYWKEHTDRWCDAYVTCDRYGDIFTSAPSAIANYSLLEVLNLGGGGIYNLGRQSVAALLNTCSSEVGFAYSDTETLIADVNDAFTSDEAGAFGIYLDGLNQAGCPLGGTSATTAPSSPECDVTGSGFALSTSLVSGFSVAPVPFVDQLNVQYHFDYVSDVNIQFFNFSGQLLQNFKFLGVTSGDISELNVGSLVSPGQTYIIKVNTDKESFSKTIISSE